MANTLLVTGASGQLGKQVLDILLAQNAGPVIGTTRTPDSLADYSARGAEIRTADFDDPVSLAKAFKGADRLLLISTGALFPAGQRLQQHRNAVAAAVEAGVKHVVYTSAPAPYPQDGGGLLDDHFWTEQALAASPLEWTILRHHLYMDMLIGTVATAAKTGDLYSSNGDGGSNYVTREDCARADAAALAADFSGRRILDVTGPGPITQAELAKLGSELTGKPIRLVPLTPEQHREGMAAAGLPPFLIDALLAFNKQAAQGFDAVNVPTVEELTGRAPTSVKDFLTANRAALIG